MTERKLEAKGRAEYSYDYANDILYFKIKDRSYRESIEFDNLIIDIDQEEFITGIRIMNASSMLRIPKYALRNIQQFEFNSRLESTAITVQLNFACVLRNKVLVNKGQDILREAPFAVEEARLATATV
jgi:uncharacterized protein YuzE